MESKVGFAGERLEAKLEFPNARDCARVSRVIAKQIKDHTENDGSHPTKPPFCFRYAVQSLNGGYLEPRCGDLCNDGRLLAV